MNSTKLIILITLFCIILLNHSALAIDEEYQTQLTQEEQQNNDDTSLFREVENAIDDEDSEEDAYRMLKSLQDVAADETEEEEYDNSNNDIEDHMYKNEKSTTNSDSNMNEENEINDEEEEEEEEAGDDLSTDFPEFQNEATTEFFEHLPKQPMPNIDSSINSEQDTIEEEELDEEIDELEPQYQEEEQEEEYINKEIEIKEKKEKDQVHENPLFDDSIPWQRPDSARFYQDIRVKESKPQQKSERSYTFWYFFLLSVVLTLLYRSISHRSNGIVELSTASSGTTSWSRDEKDYLPLHNGNKRNSYYKNEIKSS